MKTWETFHNNWKIYVFEISLLNDCTKFVKNYCASDWEILTQSPQYVQILSVLGFDHNSANCSWNRLLSLTYNVTLFAYICVTRDSESTSLREVSIQNWGQVTTHSQSTKFSTKSSLEHITISILLQTTGTNYQP